MGALNLANIRKTLYYLQRNGVKNTWYAVRERLSQAQETPYAYEAPLSETLAAQRQRVAQGEATGEYQGIEFSIVVPLYRTKPEFLQEIMESIQAQTYPFWEVVFADATEDDSVWEVVKNFSGVIDVAAESTGVVCGTDKGVVRYVHLSSNDGISANTNAALAYVTKNYIGLLDHDDILTPDALFEMAEAIRQAKAQGQDLQLIYSDEDKCNGDATEFYEPNFKEKFNYDLILSNNYICHFLVMKGELMQKLQFRRAYDGAQDYDLVLRAVSELGIPADYEKESLIAHVPKVLYHWRCHSSSTAENPRSKEYAYEAGRRALQDHIQVNGISGQAANLKHVGFYKVDYSSDVFESRKDVGIVGGPVFKRGKIIGGRMNQAGDVFYEGLSVHFGGYLHRAVLTQNADAVDIRNMSVRPELQDLFAKITGVSYEAKPGKDIFDVTKLPAGTDYQKLSLKLCRAVREEGYRILWCRRDNE